jgi:hypothetical protein
VGQPFIYDFRPRHYIIGDPQQEEKTSHGGHAGHGEVETEKLISKGVRVYPLHRGWNGAGGVPCRWNSAKCPFLLPNNVRPFGLKIPSSDHAKGIFLAFSQSTQRSQSFASRTDSVFKPGMGKDMEEGCKRAGGNSKSRDQRCGDYDRNCRAGRVLISRITWMEVLGALLVTRNTRDFDPTEPGVRIPDRLS